MDEIMNGKAGDVSQYPEKANCVEGSSSSNSSSFEDEFNSTFDRLKAMQEEIMSKRIAELEEQLSDLEVFATKIINEVQNI